MGTAAALLGCYGIPQIPWVWARDEDEAVGTAERLAGADGRAVMKAFGDRLTGVLLQPLAERGTELLADHAGRLAPLSDRDVHELITAPRCAPMLFGSAGSPAAGVEALE